jgi:hypothetical protein
MFITLQRAEAAAVDVSLVGRHDSRSNTPAEQSTTQMDSDDCATFAFPVAHGTFTPPPPQTQPPKLRRSVRTRRPRDFGSFVMY